MSHETKGQENHFGKYQRKMNMRNTTAVSYPFSLEGLGPSPCSEVARGSLSGGWKNPAVLGLAPAAAASSQNSEPSPWGSGLSQHEASFKFQVFSFKFLCALIHLSLGQTYT